VPKNMVEDCLDFMEQNIVTTLRKYCKKYNDIVLFLARSVKSYVNIDKSNVNTFNFTVKDYDEIRGETKIGAQYKPGLPVDYKKY